MRFVVSACCLALALNAAAQQPASLPPYQAGAGAYFAGRTDQAEKHLTQAIEENPEDPRAYYLRGLNRLRVNDLRGAQSDLGKGSELEARMGSSSPLIDQSLASVQGSARLMLERIRRDARQAAEVEARQQINAAMKQHRETRERVVLRTDYQLPMEALASRLSVDQARQAANKMGTSPKEQVATSSSSPVKKDDPFADDAYDEATTFAATPAPVIDPSASAATASDTTNDVDVPEAARGSMKASGLRGVIGRSVADAGQKFAEASAAAFTGAIPPGAIPPGMAPPGMAPPGMGPGEPPPGFGPAGPEAMPTEVPASEDPFAQGEGDTAEAEGETIFNRPDANSPMQQDSTDSSQASPFDFGS